MSRWFRHYAGMCRDDKLVRAALRSKQPIERVVWVWGAILESAAEVNDNGRYDFDIGEASYFLRADESDVARIVDSLESLERIREGAVVRWGDRQFPSDTSAERQKRYRDRKKTSNQDNSDGVVTGCDGVVTSPSRPSDAPELETETDIPEANASGAMAVEENPPKPVYSDARHELWGEGKRMLAELGVPASKAGSLIGQWVKESGDDCPGVLDAIRRAREHKAVEPIAWIVRALPNRKRHERPNAKGSLVDAGLSLIRKLDEQAEQSMRAETGGPPRDDDARLLSFVGSQRS